MSRNWFKAEEGYRSSDLLQSGFDHLIAAELLSKAGNPWLLDSSGYLAQLGLELVLKSMLLEIAGKFPDDHSLDNLKDRLSAQGLEISLDTKAASVLATIAKFGALRYPNPQSPVSVSMDTIANLPVLFYSIAEAFPDSLAEAFDRLHMPNEDGRFEKCGRFAMFRPKEPPA